MNKAVVQVQVKAVLPTSNAVAVFLGNTQKVFIIYVDQNVGAAITMFMRGVTKERPLTHDLLANVLLALGGKVQRVVVNELKNSTYFARLIINAENEIQTQRKIVEIDARPSDCIALAIQQKAPIFIAKEVWDEVEDMSEVLKKMEQGVSSEENESEEES
jgi:hypothetical protein